MANICSNSLRVFNIKDFVSKYGDLSKKDNEYFYFEKVIPIGKWEYNKAIENWNTKWEPEIISFDEIENGYQIGFNTAWSPPINVVRKIIENEIENKNYDASATLYYFEPGTNLFGILRFFITQVDENEYVVEEEEIDFTDYDNEDFEDTEYIIEMLEDNFSGDLDYIKRAVLTTIEEEILYEW